MDTVLALAILSLGMFLMVCITGLFYLTSVRPRLLIEEEAATSANADAYMKMLDHSEHVGGAGEEGLQATLDKLLVMLQNGQERTESQEQQLMLLAQQINAHLDQQTRQIDDMTLQLNAELHAQDATLNTIISRLEQQSDLESDTSIAGSLRLSSAQLMKRLTDLSEQVNQLAGTLMQQDALVREVHTHIVSPESSEPLYIIMGRQGTLIKEMSDKLTGFDAKIDAAAPKDLGDFSRELDSFTTTVQGLKQELSDQQTTIGKTLQDFASDRSLTAITGALREQAEKLGKLDARIDEQTDTLTQAIATAGAQKGTLDEISDQLEELVPDIDKISKRKTRVIRRPNRLMDIKGIGPVYAGMLHEAGIQTFKQLASFTPDQLKDLIDAPGWRGIQAENWIEQAQLLADVEDKVEEDN